MRDNTALPPACDCQVCSYINLKSLPTAENMSPDDFKAFTAAMELFTDVSSGLFTAALASENDNALEAVINELVAKGIQLGVRTGLNIAKQEAAYPRGENEHS